jgi:hypothetical protein
MNKTVGWRHVKIVIAPPIRTREVNDMPITVQNKLVRNPGRGIA